MNEQMQKITLNMDLSNAKALALLNYIRTLDFVTFERSNILSEIQKQAIDVGINALEQGQSYKHNDIMSETKKRYPNLFN